MTEGVQVIAELNARIEALETELETERLRLAACGAAALGYFQGCKDEYRSAALEDVLRLRKDAERYRVLRDMHWSTHPYCVVSMPKENVRLGAFCPSHEGLDSALDTTIKIRAHEAAVKAGTAQYPLDMLVNLPPRGSDDGEEREAPGAAINIRVHEQPGPAHD